MAKGRGPGRTKRQPQKSKLTDAQAAMVHERWVLGIKGAFAVLAIILSSIPLAVIYFIARAVAGEETTVNVTLSAAGVITILGSAAGNFTQWLTGRARSRELERLRARLAEKERQLLAKR